MLMDWHVNLLPDWARCGADWIDLAGETPSLRQAYRHPAAAAINHRASTPDILQAMDSAGVRRALCFSYQWLDEQRCNAATDFVCQEVAANRDRLLGLAVIQPRASGAVQRLEAHLDRPGIIGLKVKPKWGGFALSDFAVMGPVYECLQARNKILLTHVTQGFHAPSGDQVTDLFAMLRQFPKLIVVAAHFGGFIDIYANYAPVRRAMENLYIDVSLHSGFDWLAELMRRGNPDRYLYATDFPFIGYDELNGYLEQANLNQVQRDAIMHRNSAALLARLGLD